MTSLSTEQKLPFTMKVVDGRGRPVKIDGEPVAASSDETVATVTIADAGGGTWNGEIVSVAPSPEGTTQRVTVTADADLSPSVSNVVGILEFNVTLDERTSARMVTLSPGSPVDKDV